MTFRSRLLIPLSFALLAVTIAAPPNQAATGDDAAVAFFEKKVRPILVDNCYNCHSADTNARGGLRVDDRNGLLQGGKRGPAVVPGHPELSLLIKAVRHTAGKLMMPPKKDLAAGQIADLEKWIQDGAAWPKVKIPASLGAPRKKYEKLRKEHWAFQPLRQTIAPAVKDASWGRGGIDRFILAGLEQKNLRPVGDADKITLLRRVTFDLTGLPPTLAELDAFVKDNSADAFAKVVDRLLASPAYGERWGRHWLDVARYGESTGSARNLPYPHAWRYRDYVIDAVTNDKPYDRFIREQIAGDLLPANSQKQRDEQTIATGFLALGVKDVNQRFTVRFIMDNVDEQIDTVTRSVLALTASCARCHDHKFDPIPTTDYYALAGIFRSSDLCAGVRNKMGGGGLDYYDTQMLLAVGPKSPSAAPPAEKIAKLQNALALARKDFQSISGTPAGKARDEDGRSKQMVARQKVNKLQVELLALNDPAANGRAAFGVREAKTVSDTEVRIRGEAEKLGPVVARGYLSVIDVPDAPKVNPKQSGRLELAQWLTSPKNPLTSRVMVNRVWHHLFGQGLVGSVDNFGVTGEKPSHPELLDYLALQFVKDEYSVKKLVRTIVLSRAYQLSSDALTGPLGLDPSNRLVWRHSPRRLDAEEIRDAMLAAAGKLNLARPHASPAKELKVIELRNNGAEAKRIGEAALASTHRSVYLPLVRNLIPKGLEVFDFAEQGMVTGKRDTTTVATQALYLLNDPFVLRQARSLADRLAAQTGREENRIHLAYRLTLGRTATPKEIQRVKTFLADYQVAVKQETNPAADRKTAAWTSFCQALLGSAEFRYLP